MKGFVVSVKSISRGSRALIAGILFLGAIPAICAAQSTTPRQLADFNRDTRTFEAGFLQIQYDADGNRAQQLSGTFYLQRPGKFRWDYKQPYQQQIVSNGKKLWMYDLDLEQVTISPVNESLGSTPAFLLGGNDEIEKSFSISDLGYKNGLDWIELIPKNQDTNFSHIRLGFNQQGLSEMDLLDSFQQRTQIRFSGVYVNRSIDADRFHFSIPEGVDVIGE